jgi:hypothetical protein
MSFVPRWFVVWMVISYLIMIWDASYVLLRPATMKSGHLFSYYSPYELYIKYDTLYGNLKDRFVVAQSQLNLIEVVIAFIALAAASSKIERTRLAGGLLCLVVTCFTFWKTVLYVVYGSDHLVVETGKEVEFLFVFIIPTALWLVFPLAGIYGIGERILRWSEQKVKQQ